MRTQLLLGIALSIVTSVGALAAPKSTVDHRTNTRSLHSSTSNAPGGVTVSGYNGHGSGRAHPKPTVRDHRTKPVVRDHRSKPVVRDHRKPPVVLKFP